MSRPIESSLTPGADSTRDNATVSLAVGVQTACGVLGSPAALTGFELLDEIGRGGMGAVFRARDATLDREVADKILQEKYASDSPVAARFVEEARITGQLQHPGIPAVYQFGALPDGRPFLAMKLIKGRTLDELLKAGAAIDPLAVFESIAQAVGYAHAHNVIHRDLKPANVMVGAFGEVQVMDWGLAKVLTPSGETEPLISAPEAIRTEIRAGRDSQTPFTQHGSVLGTPAYMAPEQAAGEMETVGARSDVFGLGAILCVLLTGRAPFEGKDMESVRLNAVRGRTDDAFARLDACGADPDVVALCKRCLAFEPSERPATADEAATAVAALRRAADDRAKQAERDKLAAEVQAAELAKRRRAVQWAAGVVAVVLLAGIVGTTTGLLRADAARQAEAEQRQNAEAKEAEASAVVKFFEEKLFAAARPKGQEGGLGKDVTLRQAITASLPALAMGFKDQPLVEARLRRTLGNTFRHLGDAQAATEQLEQARAIFSERLGTQHLTTLQSMRSLTGGYAELGRRAEALKLCEETLAACKRSLPPDHTETLLNMNNLASIYNMLGRYTEALTLREETLAAQKRVLPPDHADAVRSMADLAVSYDDLGRHADALKLFEECLAARKRVLPAYHPDTLMSMNDVAVSFHVLRRYADAMKLHEETLAARKRVLPPDHPETLRSMYNLASTYAALGRGADAMKLRENTLAARRRVLPPDHPDVLNTMGDLATSYEIAGRLADALKLREEAFAAYKRSFPPDHPETLVGMSNLAHTYYALGRRTEALKLYEETLAARRRDLPLDHPDTLTSMDKLAYTYYDLGRRTEALKLYEETLAARKRALGPDHPDTLQCMGDLARSYASMGRHRDAVVLYRAAAEAWEKLNRTEPDSFYNAACFWAVAAAASAKANQQAEASADADRAMGWLTKALDAGFRNRAHMAKDIDLEALRGRADFRALVESLPTPVAAPAKQ